MTNVKSTTKFYEALCNGVYSVADAICAEVFLRVMKVNPVKASRFAESWGDELPDLPDMWVAIGRDFVSSLVTSEEIATRVWEDFPLTDLDEKVDTRHRNIATNIVVLNAIALSITDLLSA